MKAADISDEQVLAVCDAAKQRGCWATMKDVQDAIAGFPYKVLHAKVRQMIYKGRLCGCPCGCRGDLSRPLGQNTEFTARREAIKH